MKKKKSKYNCINKYGNTTSRRNQTTTVKMIIGYSRGPLFENHIASIVVHVHHILLAELARDQNGASVEIQGWLVYTK